MTRSDDTCQGHGDLRESLAVLFDAEDLVVSFTVLGEPAPQGSKIRNRYGGIREANPRTRPYRQAVADEAAIAFDGEPVTGPLILLTRFFFARPQGHYGSGRNAEVLKPSAPQHKTTAPDVLKLGRLIEDAMKTIVYRDDSQVIRHDARKFFGSPARTEVEVYSVAHDRSPPLLALHAA